MKLGVKWSNETLFGGFILPITVGFSLQNRFFLTFMVTILRLGSIHPVVIFYSGME
jgi:hypothetical protein